MDIRRADPTAGYAVRSDKQMEYGKISHSESGDITKQSEKELRDTIQISDAAYRMQKEDQKVSATSGNDILGISKGVSDNEYVVHFSDTAMVNRAVSRGYIKVNDTEITLSDDDKEKLLKTDREAEQKRLRAYESYVMEHEAAVAKQQGEALSKAYEDIIDRLSKILDPDKELSWKDAPEGVNWSDFEWKTYDTSMKVSMEGEPSIGDIFVSENNVAH